MESLVSMASYPMQNSVIQPIQHRYPFRVDFQVTELHAAHTCYYFVAVD
jgi:hypothetical protein